MTSLLRTPQFVSSIFQAYLIVAKQKPDVFLSFGGYMAVPLAIAAWMQQIPVVTHEQTRAVGVSNQFISRFAKKIAISHQDSKKFFPAAKTILTGNLIRKQLTSPSILKPSWMTSNSSLPLLYITGGSQGSEIINTSISQMLPRLLKDWQIIHQCGAASSKRSYFSELQNRRKSLTKPQQSRYVIREWILESELAWIYKNATAVISRAGANTTQELSLNCIPSILIPLPFSHHQEQLLNAEALAKEKCAIVIPQKSLTTESLLTALETLKSKNNSFRKRLQDKPVKLDADKKVYNILVNVLPAQSEKKA